MGRLLLVLIVGFVFLKMMEQYVVLIEAQKDADLEVLEAQGVAYNDRLDADEDAMRACGNNFVCGFTKVITSLFG